MSFVTGNMANWQSTRKFGLVRRSRKKLMIDISITKFYLGAECQALCRAVNGAVYFSHYNKVSDPTDYSLTCPSLHSREMTSEMTTRATAAVSRPVPGPGASVVTEIVMMMMMM